MVELIANNPMTEINKADCYGVNAFWIAAFYGHVDVIAIEINLSFKYRSWSFWLT